MILLNAFKLTIFILIIPSLISIYATVNYHLFPSDIEWIKAFGALPPQNELIALELWRCLTAPLLHFHFTHLVGNALLLLVANLVYLQRKGLSAQYYTWQECTFMSTRLYGCGALIAILRTLGGSETWSMGLSGVGLAFLSFELVQAGLSHKYLTFYQRAFLVCAAWLFLCLGQNENVDQISHFVGLSLGSLGGLINYSRERTPS